MTQNSSKKPVSLRKLSPGQKAEENIYRMQLRSSHARMPGESIVERGKRGTREVRND